ncbi:MAG: type II toxin-antitoxin system RelB/DinJ family antitoxin [Erysipelotrichaceae bacterium]|jgi:DNA-damage-inducible protein J|nr:type II toxin-antitoxin system RelB/DinJ family antitoxin [Erysipelotrichaceae bacterium]
MSVKSSNVYARIEPEVKEQAESILSALGIPASNAINMFYKQIILQNGLPFEVKLSVSAPIDMKNSSDQKMNEELVKGYTDMKTGKTKSAEKCFNKIRKDYGL